MTTYTISTGNVFADLDFPNAAEHQVKAQLAFELSRRIADQWPTQTAAADALGIRQSNLSDILTGKLRHVSVDRLMRLLTKAGCDVDIVVRHTRADSDSQIIIFPRDSETRSIVLSDPEEQYKAT